MPSVLAQVPKERDWFSTPDAIIQSTEDLAQLVLTAAELPPTTALWLRTGWPQGWQRVSSLAKVPPGDLVVKAVMGQSAHRSGGHVCCIARLQLSLPALCTSERSVWAAAVQAQMLCSCHGTMIQVHAAW